MKTNNLCKIISLSIMTILIACNHVCAGDESPMRVSDATFGLKLVLKLLPDVDRHMVELRLENHSNKAITIDKQAMDRANLSTSIESLVVQTNSETGVVTSGSISLSFHGGWPHLSIEQIAGNPARIASIAPNESYAVKIDLDRSHGDMFQKKDAARISIRFRCPHIVLGYVGERPSKKMNDVELVSNSVTIDVAASKGQKAAESEKGK